MAHGIWPLGHSQSITWQPCALAGVTPSDESIKKAIASKGGTQITNPPRFSKAKGPQILDLISSSFDHKDS